MSLIKLGVFGLLLHLVHFYLQIAVGAHLVADGGRVVDEGKVSLGRLLDPHETVHRGRHRVVLLDDLEHVGVHLADRVVPHAESASCQRMLYSR